MKKRNSWKIISRLSSCKWVFKVKRNNVNRARLVALGYMQTPGIDFTENYAPVADDESIELVLEASHSNNKWHQKSIQKNTFMWKFLKDWNTSKICLIIAAASCLVLLVDLYKSLGSYLRSFVRVLKEKLHFNHFQLIHVYWQDMTYNWNKCFPWYMLRMEPYLFLMKQRYG